MELNQEIKDSILKVISNIGAGATIREIEKNVSFERHTLSKYLSFMEAHGLIYHQMIGKAKVWQIEHAPLRSILASPESKKLYTEKILSRLISTMPCGFFVVDNSFNIIFMNELSKSKYNDQTNTLFYNSILGLPNPIKIKQIKRVLYGEMKEVNLEIEDKQNNFLSIKAGPFNNPDNSISAMLMVEDITAAKQSKDLIFSQNMQLAAGREALNKSAIVAETDLAGKLTYVNDKFIEISGYKEKELLGNTHEIINSGFHDRDFFKNLWSTISKGKVWTGLIKNKAKNGTFYWVQSAIAPIFGKDRKPERYIAIRFDVTKYMDKN